MRCPFSMMIAILVVHTQSLAQSQTALTYQGSLIDAGQPASGSYDIDVGLWDAPSGGARIGPALSFPAASVTDGLFTLQLDFGAAAFDNEARWLQIAVAGVVLSPRQPVTRAPYAIQTRGIFVDAGGNVGIGATAPMDELHVRGDQATLRLEDDADPGSFTELKDAQPTQLRINKTNSSGVVLLDLNPKPADGASSALLRIFRETNTTGAKAVQFLRGNFTSQTSASIGVDGADSWFQAHGGNLGVGTEAPKHRLHSLAGPSGIAVFGEVASGSGYAVQGLHAPTEGGGQGVFGRSNSIHGIGVYGLASATSGSATGVQGHSNSPFGYDFYATGSGIDYGASSSRRWKRNIEEISEPLDKLARVRGVTFDWDAEHGGHHDIGMIAEEVGAVIPEIVVYEANGVDASAMDYSKLAPLLVEAVKALRTEQGSQIAALRDENEALRGRLIALEATVEQLVSSHTGSQR